MSKRTQPDSARAGTQPSRKKARYTYNPEIINQQHILPRTTTNSDEETASEIENLHSPTKSTPQKQKQKQKTQQEEDTNTLFLSTRKPITSKIPIESEIIPKSETDWCPVQWFRNRAYHSDVNEFFSILPYEEASGVTQRLLELNGGSITLTNNLINILSKMEQISKYIHNDITNTNKHNNKRKKRFISKQNEIFNTINISQLKKNNNNYINKLQNTINKYNSNKNEHISYENERKLIWKSLSNNNSITPTPPPITHNPNKSDIIKTEEIEREESDFISSDDDDSDESFTILNDNNNRKKKQKKRKKKKSKKQKLEEEIERERQKEIEAAAAAAAAAAAQQQDIDMYDGGKNPVYADTQPQKFWNKFIGYFEPQNPQNVEEIIPYLQSDIFPTKIPSLPLEKTFITKSYNFDDFDDDLPSFDDLNSINTNTNTNNNTHNKCDSDNELYFAEMPKNYEYFLDRKCYIDEQINIESMKNNKYIGNKSHGIYSNYPYKSLYSHSFDQRTLSAIVHECDGLYNIEGNCDENNWKKIGTKKLIERRKKEWEKDRDKKKNGKDKKRSHYKNVKMIEPIIKYKNEPINSNNNKETITYEKALRKELCKYIYGGDITGMDKIIKMPWNQRQDDECCTCIKSLDNNLEEDCFKYAPNDIDTNVKIGKEIVNIMRDKYNVDINNFHSWREFNQHINVLQKNHIDTRGEFVIDQETLNLPEWSQYFKEKQNLPVQQAVQAFMQKDYVQTKQED